MLDPARASPIYTYMYITYIYNISCVCFLYLPVLLHLDPVSHLAGSTLRGEAGFFQVPRRLACVSVEDGLENST